MAQSTTPTINKRVTFWPARFCGKPMVVGRPTPDRKPSYFWWDDRVGTFYLQSSKLAWTLLRIRGSPKLNTGNGRWDLLIEDRNLSKNLFGTQQKSSTSNWISTDSAFVWSILKITKIHLSKTSATTTFPLRSFAKCTCRWHTFDNSQKKIGKSNAIRKKNTQSSYPSQKCRLSDH